MKSRSLRWFEAEYIEKDHNPSNYPELWPIETYWAQVKKIIKKDSISKNKLTDTFVQNIMKGLKAKVCEFGWQKIKRLF